MGRHSLPESPGFWRAVILAGLRYLVVLILIVAVGFGAYNLFFDRGADESDAEGEFTPPATDPFDFEEPAEQTPDPTPESTGRVQVLDGSNSAPRLNAAGDKLEEAGYEVVAREPLAATQERTVVAYHPGQQQMAEAVASLLGIALVEPVGDRNLNPDIPVSVLIGPDYAG